MNVSSRWRTENTIICTVSIASFVVALLAVSPHVRCDDATAISNMSYEVQIRKAAFAAIDRGAAANDSQTTLAEWNYVEAIVKKLRTGWPGLRFEPAYRPVKYNSTDIAVLIVARVAWRISECTDPVRADRLWTLMHALRPEDSDSSGFRKFWESCFSLYRLDPSRRNPIRDATSRPAAPKHD